MDEDLNAWLGTAFDLMTEVHKLAYSYHWGISEIMTMTKMKRQQWCKMLDVQGAFEAEALKKK